MNDTYELMGIKFSTKIAAGMQPAREKPA